VEAQQTRLAEAWLFSVDPAAQVASQRGGLPRIAESEPPPSLAQNPGIGGLGQFTGGK